MAWGKIGQFLRRFSRDRVSRDAEVTDPMWDREVRNDNDWEYQAMRYTPLHGVTPGNHP